jgi:hypothetical protein
MRPAAAVFLALLSACLHSEPATAPKIAAPQLFDDLALPRGGVQAAATPDIAAAVNAQYRLRPDGRVLIALADIHELLAGERERPAIDFAGGRWTVTMSGKEIGTLPELPEFRDLFALLVRHAAWFPAEAASGETPAAPFDVPGAFTAAKASGKPAGAAATLAHAAVAINMQTIDRFGFADPLRARALALLAIARSAKAKDLDGDLAILADILADILGYQSEAKVMAAALPADALARAWVLRSRPAARDAAAVFVAARTDTLAARGADRLETAESLAARLPARALPLLMENTAFADSEMIPAAAANLVAADVAGDAMPARGTAAAAIEAASELDLPKIVSIFETSLAARSEALASPAFPRELVPRITRRCFTPRCTSCSRPRSADSRAATGRCNSSASSKRRRRRGRRRCGSGCRPWSRRVTTEARSRTPRARWPRSRFSARSRGRNSSMTGSTRQAPATRRYYARYTILSAHGPRAREEFHSRDGRPQRRPSVGLSLPTSSPRSARNTGPCLRRTTEGDLRPWMLLASTRWLRSNNDSEDAGGILGSEVRGQLRAGQARATAVARRGLGVLVVWECQTFDRDSLVTRLVAFFE